MRKKKEADVALALFKAAEGSEIDQADSPQLLRRWLTAATPVDRNSFGLTPAKAFPFPCPPDGGTRGTSWRQGSHLSPGPVTEISSLPCLSHSCLFVNNSISFSAMCSVTILSQARKLPLHHKALMNEFKIDNQVPRDHKGQEYVHRVYLPSKHKGWAMMVVRNDTASL